MREAFCIMLFLLKLRRIKCEKDNKFIISAMYGFIFICSYTWCNDRVEKQSFLLTWSRFKLLILPK